MGIYDTIMLIVLAAATFLGWRKGMVGQVAAIVSVVASFMVATTFYQQVAASINAPDPWDRIAGFVLVYLGTSLVVWVLFRQIRNSVKQMQLGDFDRQLGALLGAGKGVVVVAVITLVAVNLLSAEPKAAIAASRTGLVVSRIVHTIGPMTPPRIQDFLATYVQQLDAVLGQPGDPSGAYSAPAYQVGGPEYDYRYSDPGGPYVPPAGYYPQSSQYVPPNSPRR